MKKVLFILSLVMLISNITLAHSNYSAISQQENFTSLKNSRKKGTRITMKENCMTVKQKSGSSFVLQFDDKLSVFYRTNDNYTIQITDMFGRVLHSQQISGNTPNRTEISLIGYQDGEYTIKLIISENNYSYGSFIIE